MNAGALLRLVRVATSASQPALAACGAGDAPQAGRKAPHSFTGA